MVQLNWNPLDLVTKTPIIYQKAFVGLERNMYLEDITSVCEESEYKTFPGGGGGRVCRDTGLERQPEAAEEIGHHSDALNG